MKTYYPIMLDLTGKNVVVIGGGKVAERKVKGLREAKANIIVIATEVTAFLKELTEKAEITWVKKRFSPEDVEGAFLIIAATNTREINEAVARAAKSHQLLNVVDAPEQSTFHVPSVVRRGKLSIAVSTGGASPVLAKKICQEIAEMYDEDYGQYIDFLYECRQYILRNVSELNQKRQLLEAITDELFRKSKNWEEEFCKLFERIMGE
jgi:precorrin-2 dehydrogenase/sirohydrochlorin ferrochelatase